MKDDPVKGISDKSLIDAAENKYLGITKIRRHNRVVGFVEGGKHVREILLPENERLTSERDRMREALEDIVNGGWIRDEMIRIANRALKGE